MALAKSGTSGGTGLPVRVGGVLAAENRCGGRCQAGFGRTGPPANLARNVFGGAMPQRGSENALASQWHPAAGCPIESTGKGV